jgi:hypothetical protein
VAGIITLLAGAVCDCQTAARSGDRHCLLVPGSAQLQAFRQWPDTRRVVVVELNGCQTSVWIRWPHKHHRLPRFVTSGTCGSFRRPTAFCEGAISLFLTARLEALVASTAESKHLSKPHVCTNYYKEHARERSFHFKTDRLFFCRSEIRRRPGGFSFRARLIGPSVPV